MSSDCRLHFTRVVVCKFEIERRVLKGAHPDRDNIRLAFTRLSRRCKFVTKAIRQTLHSIFVESVGGKNKLTLLGTLRNFYVVKRQHCLSVCVKSNAICLTPGCNLF